MFHLVAEKKTFKMDLLASYGDDGEKSESPGPSSDVGEKDASPVARVPSFTPYLQAEWESFEKLIAGGGGESQNELTPNVEMVKPIPPDSEFSDGSNPSEEISKRELEDSSNPLGVKSHLHNQSPFHGYSSNSSSHSTSSSQSSSLERSRDSKKINEEIINVPSRSPSRSIEHRSSSNSPIAITEESPNRHSGSDSPVHSSPSRSQSNCTSRYSREPLPDHRRGEKSRSRSHSRSRSRSRSNRRSRSRSRGSRQRRKKYSHRSRSRSRSRKHRRSRSPHKKSKHRRRSRSQGRHRSRERGRSRSRDRFGRNMRGRDSYRDRSPTSSRRRSRSSERSRDRESYRNSRDYGRRDSRDGGSSRNKKKPLNYREQMRQELTKASKMLTESNIENLTELIEDNKKILEPLSDQPTNAVLSNLVAATQNAPVTPQVALLQTMAAMHKKAQEITGIAVPKYYNPAAVNPLKYAEQVQKRKLLWSRTPKEKKEGGPENQWQGTHFSTDQDGKMAAKFRKLMGMKSGEQEGTERVGEERKKQQEELFSRLDKEYEFARMATHTHRGVGLGFQSQNHYQN